MTANVSRIYFPLSKTSSTYQPNNRTSPPPVQRDFFALPTYGYSKLFGPAALPRRRRRRWAPLPPAQLADAGCRNPPEVLPAVISPPSTRPHCQRNVEVPAIPKIHWNTEAQPFTPLHTPTSPPIISFPLSPPTSPADHQECEIPRWFPHRDISVWREYQRREQIRIDNMIIKHPIRPVPNF